MATTLDGSALTTLQSVKDDLGISASDASRNGRIEKAIKRASGAAVSFIGRKLHYDAAIVEKLPALGSNVIVLKRAPLWSITSIAYNGATVDVSNYEINNSDAATVYCFSTLWSTRLHNDVTSYPMAGIERELLQVTYAGGWFTPQQALGASLPSGVDALPDDIEAAVARLAVTFMRRAGRDPDVASESLLGSSRSYRNQNSIISNASNALGIPDDIASALSAYRDVVQSS